MATINASTAAADLTPRAQRFAPPPRQPEPEPKRSSVPDSTYPLRFRSGFAQISPSNQRLLLLAQDKSDQRIAFSIPGGYRTAYDRFPPTSFSTTA